VPERVQLEGIDRFCWSGGLYPCLDVLIETKDALIGIESKRYEPYRGKTEPEFSETYWRPVWGDAMKGFESIRDGLRDSSLGFVHLDAAQLVKHAFGLRTAVHREDRRQSKRPYLYYILAEPKSWPGGPAIPEAAHQAHWSEVARFADLVAGDEVGFHACSYRDLLTSWERSGASRVQAHAAVVRERFDVCGEGGVELLDD